MAERRVEALSAQAAAGLVADCNVYNTQVGCFTLVMTNIWWFNGGLMVI